MTATGLGRATLHAAGMSIRFRRRTSIVLLALLVVIAVASLGALMLGDYGLDVAQVLSALAGRSADPLATYFVVDVRFPRVAAALLVGAVLGVSGAIFQTVSGNALGSPDIIGFSAGSATGALIAIIVVGAGTVGTQAGSLAGGLAAAAIVYVLAWRGGASGFRLVLVGIGVAAVLGALNSLLVVKASLQAAQTAQQWLAGSLSGIVWPQVAALALVLVLAALACAGTWRGLDALRMGDELAAALGVRVQRTRLIAVLVGVVLVSAATAVAGPVAFVALAAPHLQRSLTRSAGPALVGSGLVGALLVLLADVVAQRVFAPSQLPVGVVTGALGGVYLIVVLTAEWRKNRA